MAIKYFLVDIYTKAGYPRICYPLEDSSTNAVQPNGWYQNCDKIGVSAYSGTHAIAWVDDASVDKQSNNLWDRLRADPGVASYVDQAAADAVIAVWRPPPAAIQIELNMASVTALYKTNLETTLDGSGYTYEVRER
jgi:hypothetical protein